MAVGKVTGATEEELEEMRENYYTQKKYNRTGVPFETTYCLTTIGKQPEEYDGPDRYCKNAVQQEDDGRHHAACRFHGGDKADNGNDQLSPTANMRHGMYATDEHLEEEFTEQDQKLYDWVMSWAETYGWPSKEEDPSRYDDLEAIAMARVRIARSNKYILSEGEMKRQEIYDEAGNLIEKDNPHALSEDVRLKRKLITDIKKELGITPKARSRMDTDEKEADAAEQLAKVAGDAILGDSDDEGGGFDPDDAVFEED